MSKTVPADQAAADTDFYRAFAGRVRTQLANNTREGDPTEVSALPATFQPANPHDNHPWCTVTDPAADCQSREIGLPSPEGHGLNLLAAHFFHDAEDGETGILYDRGGDDWQRLSPDELRAETARVRAHAVRLDALADQADAIAEAAAIRRAEASLAEHGGTPEQFGVLDDIKQIVGETGEQQAITRVLMEAATLTPGTVVVFKQYGGTLRVAYDPRWVTRDKAETALAVARGAELLDLIEPTPYTVPTDCGEAARITCAGERGAILNAYLYTSEWEGVPDGPTVLSVYGEPSNEGELDLAGARDLRAQLVEFLPKLDAMIDVLAEQDGAQR